MGCSKVPDAWGRGGDGRADGTVRSAVRSAGRWRSPSRGRWSGVRAAVGRGRGRRARFSAGEPAHGLGREVLVDVLGLAVLGEAGRAEFASDAGLAEAAPLGLREVGVEVVDPDGAVPQPAGDPAGAARRRRSRRRRRGRTRCRWRGRRPRPRWRRSPRSGRVRRPPRGPRASRGGTGRGRSARRTSRWRAGRRRARGACRRTAARAPSASAEATYASVFSSCCSETSGPHSTPSSVPRPSRIALGAAGEFGDEAVAHGLLDDEPGAGRADLAAVDEGGVEGLVDGGVEALLGGAGVGEDDVGVLAAEFQRDLLDACRRRPCATFVPLTRPPVKETRSTSGCSARRAPTVWPGPVTMLATPAGRPASASRPDQVRRWSAG